jgi:hypothetical protein
MRGCQEFGILQCSPAKKSFKKPTSIMYCGTIASVSFAAIYKASIWTLKLF